jgi:hypothetical protein
MSDNYTFGVIEAPKDLVLRKDETIEWFVTRTDPKSHTGKNSFIIHANTSERASKEVERLFPGTKILKVEYYGTYQY